MVEPKPVYENSSKKCRWIEHASIYNHAKFEIEQKLVWGETKWINHHLNSYCATVHGWFAARDSLGADSSFFIILLAQVFSNYK
jgi:hypothetical protein